MKISLRTKIIALSLAIVFFSGLVITYGIYSTSKVAAEYAHVAKINLPNAEAMGSMQANQKDSFVHLQLWHDSGKTKELLDLVKSDFESYEKSDKWYQDIPFVPGEEAIYQEVDKSFKAYKENVEKALAGQMAIIDIRPSYEKYDHAIITLIKFQGNEGKIWSAKAEELAESARRWQIITLLVIAGLSTVVSVLFGKRISDRIQLAVAQLTENAKSVTAASSQIAESSQSLSEATTEQSAALQETSSALEQITSMIVKSSESSSSAERSAAESHEQAELGQSAMGQMLESMGQISESNQAVLSQVNESNERMMDILKIIEEITSKTRVINDIVFQTKLLSFNASVESARAGEYGKGFSVVAEEVGNLAQMSGNAAKEITEMLERSTRSVEAIANETKQKVQSLTVEVKGKVDTGISTAERCSGILQEIVGKVSTVSGLSQEISLASKEQSEGVTEINKAMAQLDQVTQQNAATSQQAAAAADSLSQQADNLKASVDELINLVEGSKAS